MDSWSCRRTFYNYLDRRLARHLVDLSQKIDCYSARCVEVGSDSQGIVARDEPFLPIEHEVSRQRTL